MPVLTLKCPDCGHVFKGLVLEGTKLPELWVCSRCRSDKAEPQADIVPQKHPWDDGHGPGCPCCG